MDRWPARHLRFKKSNNLCVKCIITKEITIGSFTEHALYSRYRVRMCQQKTYDFQQKWQS